MKNATTRRDFLKVAPVAAAVSIPAVAAASVASPITASPAMIEANARLQSALAERAAAKDALEWLADEWRHRWPLAPEILLGGTNADKYDTFNLAERDIIGRHIFRDTSDLTTRFSAKQRRETPRACFHVDTTDRLQEKLTGWEKMNTKARTEAGRLRNQKRRDKMIRQHSQSLVLARAYEAETHHLRQAADVEGAKQRIKDAKANVTAICREISNLPALSLQDLIIKAKAIDDSESLVSIEEMATLAGAFGDAARFIQAAVELAREA